MIKRRQAIDSIIRINEFDPPDKRRSRETMWIRRFGDKHETNYAEDNPKLIEYTYIYIYIYI